MLLACASEAAAAAGRETLRFDFAWRHTLETSALGPPPVAPPAPGPAPPSCPSNLKAAFKEQMGICSGLHKQPTAASADQCQDSCCWDQSCLVWQFANTSTKGGGCWTGRCSTPVHNSSIWTGGIRATPAPLPPPPPAPPPAPPPPAPPPVSAGPLSQAYDDSGWELLDVPHDFIIGSAYTPDTAGSGHSYLPRNNSYYRKRFKIPPEWKGNAIWLQFEGVFQKAQVYVNGAFVYSDLDPGYNGFSIRLDTCQLKYGADENVVALYVSGQTGSGKC
jgi:hypothetical protein